MVSETVNASSCVDHDHQFPLVKTSLVSTSVKGFVIDYLYSVTVKLSSMENNSVVVLSVTVIVVIASFILYKQMSSGDNTSSGSKDDKKSDKSGSKSEAKKDTQDVSIAFSCKTFVLTS